jgi:MFS family permease
MTESVKTPMDKHTRQVLVTIFLTLFMDLVGFSIIFPLFPAMLDFYLAREGTTGLLGALVQILENLRGILGPSTTISDAVLFGGILGSLYSFLQFICAPIAGTLSDRFGRRPVLLVSVAGIALSYLIWIVAGQFWILVVARFLGGIMSGNISTASAAVADVTDESSRSKGMAIIGVAFGLGFILGPVIGGISSTLDVTALWPASAAYGINPFSAPAIIAFALAVVNFFFVWKRFSETLPPERRGQHTGQRTANPLRLFHVQAYPGVSKTNIAYFVFLLAFSGMEFSLTFLAAQRLGYGPFQLGMLLLYVGIVLVLVQGGYVRRRAHVIGPRRMTLQGICCAVPGLVLLGYAPNLPLLLGGLTFMALGSGQIIPCLTTLVSLYTPAADQGRVLGIFRSLGALARAVGPISVSLVYWRLGADVAYYACAVVMVIPAALTWVLPAPRTT